MNTIIHIQKPGLLTTIQDQGRKGYQAFGVPINGAMDKRSARAANWLVGNPHDAPVIEITMMGPALHIEGDCQFALTGADISPSLDGKVCAMYETQLVKNGAMLSFGALKKGCRAYMAIGGDWQVKSWLGSQSASGHMPKELTPESLLSKDSLLHIKSRSFIHKRFIRPNDQPDFPNQLQVHVLPGPEFNYFSRLQIAHFFSQEFLLRSESNRMGYRLDEALPDYQAEKEVISSGIVPGTIQVPPSGQPIILMADAQTTGGYPRIANVITKDLDRLGQLKPGDRVGFILGDLD